MPSTFIALIHRGGLIVSVALCAITVLKLATISRKRFLSSTWNCWRRVYPVSQFDQPFVARNPSPYTWTLPLRHLPYSDKGSSIVGQKWRLLQAQSPGGWRAKTLHWSCHFTQHLLSEQNAHCFGVVSCWFELRRMLYLRYIDTIVLPCSDQSFRACWMFLSLSNSGKKNHLEFTWSALLLRQVVLNI